MIQVENNREDLLMSKPSDKFTASVILTSNNINRIIDSLPDGLDLDSLRVDYHDNILDYYGLPQDKTDEGNDEFCRDYWYMLMYGLQDEESALQFLENLKADVIKARKGEIDGSFDIAEIEKPEYVS